MIPSIVVLVNLSEAAEQAARYAAVLGAPLHVRLELVNVYQPPILASGLASVPMHYFPQMQAETEDALQALAQRLPACTRWRWLLLMSPDALLQGLTNVVAAEAAVPTAPAASKGRAVVAWRLLIDLFINLIYNVA